ncbi:MAG: hypothetical protein H6907_10810 [Hyphomicrobiales bacterium]|nr:hypothetical protein [Hyphomicrobiales bacterium]MCP5372209.1 hypothetical protein [Hyphomicrobiales bacterium]
MDAQTLSREWARAAAGDGGRRDWEHMELDAVRALLARLDPGLPGAPLDPDYTLARTRPLPFYPGHALCELVNPTVMTDGNPRHAVSGDRAARLLDGTNAVVYDLNRTVPIALNGGNVRDYVRFFFAAVRGRHGHFHVVERLDDINFAGDPDPARQRQVAAHLHPLILAEADGDGGYRLRATILFKDGLFAATVAVAADGMVSMADEEMLLETVGSDPDNPVDV